MIKFENKSNARFYYLSITCDMLNDNILSVTRGGKNITISNVVAIGSYESLLKKISQITRKRLSRGYTLVS